MRTMTRLVVGLAAAAVLMHASRASAAFHLVVVDQVFLGTADCPNAQYVMMRMTSFGQTFVGNLPILAQDAGGNSTEFGRFAANLSNGASGSTFIVGTADAAGLFGLTMDQTATGHLTVDGGRVCYTSVDCVAYGDFTGNNAPRGQPAAAPPLGMALVRQTSTNNNAADFAVGAPAPRNNAGDSGTLGQCPSVGNPTATETELPTAPPTETEPGFSPTPTPIVAPGCAGDCNGDGRVLINELVLGVAIALDQQPLSVCPVFDLNQSGMVEVNELITAVGAAIAGCPTPPATSTDGPLSPSATPTTAQGALGVRRFTVNPEVSRFVGVTTGGHEFLMTGLQGFLELQAGIPDPNTGAAFIDVTDASDYLAVDVSSANMAVCIRVRRDQLPVQHAGLIACNGSTGYGVRITQDHSIGIVGTCVGSAVTCTGDGECGGAQCFTAARCTEAGGTIEGAGRPHEGVCNGPLNGSLDGSASPAGTVFIASDPVGHVINGLPVEILKERSLPCGDEGISGPVVALTLTSDHMIGRVLDANNQSGETLEASISGEPFSCDTWTQENGPGILVLSVPNLDAELAPSQFSDFIAEYVFAD